MKKALLLLLLVGGGLAIFVGGMPGLVLGVLTIAAAALLFSLRKFFPQTQASSAVSNLVAPSVGTAFAEHASTTGAGEVLLPYETYKVLRKRLLSSATTGLILLLLTLVGLRTLPVPAFFLFVPVLAVCILLLLFSSFSLFRLVPAGQRLHTLKTLFFADPRLVFAQYAARKGDGEVTVGYSTFKRRVRLTTYLVSTLAIIAFLVLAGEVQQAKNLSQENLDAASKQFQVLANSVLSGQGDVKEQLGKLLAQSLQPAPTLDEKSLTNRILASVTKNLPSAPEQIVTTNVTEKTTTINRDFIDPNTTEAIKFGSGSILSYQSSNGTVFLKLGTGPNVSIPDLATFNIQGFFQIDGTEVTATASDLNNTSNLRNTDQGNEGARYVGTRAADFTHFSPSRDDVQAALSAIDTSLGATTGSVSGFTPGSVLFANTDGTLTQDNTNFFWNSSTHRLGIGTTSPNGPLEVSKSQNTSTYVRVVNAMDNTAAVAGLYAIDGANGTIFITTGANYTGVPSWASRGIIASDAGLNGLTLTTDGTGDDIRFETGGAGSSFERVRIQGDGNVGIGTTSPDLKFKVYDTSKTTASGNGNIYVSTSDSAAADLGGSMVFGGSFNGTTDSTFGAISGRKENGTAGNTAGYLTLSTRVNAGAMTERFRIDSTGNVGIGITNPTSPNSFTKTLEVSAANASVVVNNTNGGTAWELGSETVAGGRLGIFSGTTRVMTLLGGGNVGIGTTAPTTALDILSPIDVNNGNLKLRSTNNDTAGITIWNKSSGANVNARTWQIANNYKVNGNLDFLVSADNASNPTTAKVSIDSSGNVGIGNTAPIAKLEVRSSDPNTSTLYIHTTATSGTNYGVDSELTGAATTNIAGYFSASSATNNYAIIVPGTGGNVGIGMTAPGSLLQVNGNAAIGYSSATAGPSNGLAVSGNVGIGTTAPGGQLTIVDSTTNGTQDLLVQKTAGFDTTFPITTGGQETGGPMLTLSNNNAVANSHAALVFDLGSGWGPMIAGRYTGGSVSAPQTALDFYTSNGNNLNHRMVIDNTGNVGIGTTSPQSLLDVRGVIGGGGSSGIKVDSNGNVGIGTTAPGAQLTIVDSTTNGTQDLLVSKTAGFDTTFPIATGAQYTGGPILSLSNQNAVANSHSALLFDLGSGFGSMIAGRYTGGTVSAPQTALDFYTANGANLNHRMVIDSTGNVGIGNTTPSFKLDVTGSARLTGQTTSTDGFVEKIIAGACVDGSFTTATNGLLCIDSTDGRLYFRYGGAWHYAAQTAGFQIPSILNEHTGKLETEGLKPGDLVIGQLNDRFDDGALHGVYVKFDLEDELLKLTTASFKNLVAMGALTVHGDTMFLGDVTVKGTLTLDKQQGGFATIPENGKEVEVTFDKAFSDDPVVVVTPDRNFAAAVRNRSKTGFVIRLASPAEASVVFSWLAMPIHGAKTTNGQVAGDTTTATPTPTPTPTPDAGGDTPAPSDQPTPSATATPTPTPSPTVSPTPTPSATPTATPDATDSPSPTP